MGVGMPAYLYLEEFGSQVWAAFSAIRRSMSDRR